jgi:hypothetical protein
MNVLSPKSTGFNSFENGDLFKKDLEFVYKTIFENHPGISDSANPDFLSQLTKSYQIAKDQLERIHSIEGKVLVLKDFGKSFRDSHLWIHYSKSQATFKVEESIHHFSLQKLKNNLVWIRIPAFVLSNNQTSEFELIKKNLPVYRKETIVFDLRGNGGGNSALGVDLLNSLFGEEYVRYCLKKMSRDTFVEWRASPENLAHVESVILPEVRRQFESNHSVVQWAEGLQIGMKKSIEQKKFYYTEPKQNLEEVQANVPDNLFNGKIIVIVDRGCASASLDFIDGLKATESKLILIGEETGRDSNYMELREVSMPSGIGVFGFPIKVYRNRPRGHQVSYVPDLKYSNLSNIVGLQDFVLKMDL